MLGNKHTWKNFLNSSPQCPGIISIRTKNTPDYLMSTVIYHYFPQFHYECQKCIYFKEKLLSTPDVKGSEDFENENPLKTGVQSSMRKEPIQKLLLLDYESYIQSFLSCLPVFPQATALSSNRAYFVSYCSKPLTFHLICTLKIFKHPLD